MVKESKSGKGHGGKQAKHAAAVKAAKTLLKKEEERVRNAEKMKQKRGNSKAIALLGNDVEGKTPTGYRDNKPISFKYHFTTTLDKANNLIKIPGIAFDAEEEWDASSYSHGDVLKLAKQYNARIGGTLKDDGELVFEHIDKSNLTPKQAKELREELNAGEMQKHGNEYTFFLSEGIQDEDDD